MKTLMALVVMSFGLSAMAKPCNLAANQKDVTLFTKTAADKTANQTADATKAIKKNGKG